MIVKIWGAWNIYFLHVKSGYGIVTFLGLISLFSAI